MYNPEYFENVKTMAATLIDEHVPIIIGQLHWRRFDNILDYGCGSGAVSSQFIFPMAEKFMSAVTAVDISKEMIDYAQNKHPNPRATFLAGNIMADFVEGEGLGICNVWPLANSIFDKIFCIHVLIYIENYKEYFTRLHSQLQEGGQLAFAVPYAKFYKIHHDLSDHPKWSRYLAESRQARASWPYDEKLDFPRSIKLIMKSLKMRIIDFRAYKTTFDFKNVDQFIDYVMASNSGVKNVPKELVGELRHEIGELGAKISEISITSTPFTVKLNYLRFVANK